MRYLSCVKIPKLPLSGLLPGFFQLMLLLPGRSAGAVRVARVLPSHARRWWRRRGRRRVRRRRRPSATSVRSGAERARPQAGHPVPPPQVQVTLNHMSTQ